LMDALAKLRAMRKGLFVQAFDGRVIVSGRHLLLAYGNAKAAFEEKSNFAEKLEAEVLGRAAGTRKIKEAIERVGIRDTGNLVLLFDCKKSELEAALGARELRPTFSPDAKEVARRFGLPTKALAAYPLEKLVLERVAMAGAE